MNYTKNGNDFTIKTETYLIEYNSKNSQYLHIKFSDSIGADFFAASGCDRDEYVDQLVSLDTPKVNESNNKIEIIFSGKTTLWDSVDYIFECNDSQIFYYYKVKGKGKIDNARFFESFLSEDKRMDERFYPYFPGWGRHVAFHRPVKFFNTSSVPEFDLIHSTTVNASDTRIFNYYENTMIRVGGDRFYMGGDWLVTPPPFVFFMGRKSQESWVSLGLVTKKGENNFWDYEYLGGEGFGLNLTYKGYLEVDGEWESPKILMEYTKGSFYEGLTKYISHLRDNNLVDKNDRSSTPRWWHEPIFGGWGEQMVYSAHWPHYFEGTATGWSGGSDGFCTQEKYDKMLNQLDAKKINPTILIVDNRWFDVNHHLDVDESAWPDMKAFIKEQHTKGRKVILWVSPWHYNSSSGYSFGKEVPLTEQMILEKDETYELEIDTDIFYPKMNKEKKKKRVPAEFTLEERHWEVLVNPFNADYIKRVTEKVKYLLSPDGLDADGFEFDYTHFLPLYRNIRPVTETPDIKWGVEMLHKVIEIYYKAAKAAKSDALVINHIFNPYFDDVTDMLRMQDIYTDRLSIVPQMDHRGKIAQRVCPGCAIHTDQHPMPSLYAWRDYAKFQPTFGNPCLYYVTAIETTREKLTEEDYDMLRKIWADYDAELTKKYGPKKI